MARFGVRSGSVAFARLDGKPLQTTGRANGRARERSSVWTWDATRYPVGLLFAGGGGYTICNPWGAKTWPRLVELRDLQAKPS